MLILEISHRKSYFATFYEISGNNFVTGMETYEMLENKL